MAEPVTGSTLAAADAIVSLLPGAVGGFWNVLVGHPFDLIKVRQQCNPSSACFASSSTHSLPTSVMGSANSSHGGGTTSRMLQTILLQRGVTGLYAGVSAPLVAVVPAFALSFSTFEAARTAQLQYLQTSARAISTDGYTPSPFATVDELSLSQTALAGAISGVPVALVLGPLEMLKCRLQMMPTNANAGATRVTLTDCLRQTLHEGGGIRTLFRGTGLTMLRDVPGNAVYFGTYEFLKRTLSQWEGNTATSSPSMGVTILAGGSAGVMNWIVAIPMDVVKSQWQVAPVGLYRSPWHIVRHLLHTEGPTALFRGLGPALMRAFPANAACLLGVETARKVLGPANV